MPSSSTVTLFIIALEAALCSGDGFDPPYECTGSLTDAERKETREAIVFQRFLLTLPDAYVKDKTGQALPQAQNMYNLLWDCQLETKAENAVKECRMPSSDPLYGMNFAGPSDNDTLAAIISPWFDEVQTISWPPGNIYNGSSSYKNYSNVVRAKTTSLGCSKASCGGKHMAVCYFSQPDVKKGDVVYETGKPCTDNPECTTYPGSVCDLYGLCIAPQKNNRMCPENADMNDRLRQRALQMHNYRRGRLAKGAVRKNNGVYLPTASNMNKLKYDCDIEYSAKAHADKCLATESNPASRPRLGENIHQLAASGTVLYRVNALEQSIKYWWSQVRKVPSPGVQKVTFRQHHLNSTIRYFTMMGWAETKTIGCGVTKCNGTFTVVCQYSEGGNVPDQAVYKKGPVCTQCPKGSSCTPREALCVF